MMDLSGRCSIIFIRMDTSKRKEADISLQNVEISKYEEETVSVLQRDYEHQKKKGKQKFLNLGVSAVGRKRKGMQGARQAMPMKLN